MNCIAIYRIDRVLTAEVLNGGKLMVVVTSWMMASKVTNLMVVIGCNGYNWWCSDTWWSISRMLLVTDVWLLVIVVVTVTFVIDMVAIGNWWWINNRIFRGWGFWPATIRIKQSCMFVKLCWLVVVVVSDGKWWWMIDISIFDKISVW